MYVVGPRKLSITMNVRIKRVSVKGGCMVCKLISSGHSFARQAVSNGEVVCWLC